MERFFMVGVIPCCLQAETTARLGEGGSRTSRVPRPVRGNHDRIRSRFGSSGVPLIQGRHQEGGRVRRAQGLAQEVHDEEQNGGCGESSWLCDEPLVVLLDLSSVPYSDFLSNFH